MESAQLTRLSILISMHSSIVFNIIDSSSTPILNQSILLSSQLFIFEQPKWSSKYLIFPNRDWVSISIHKQPIESIAQSNDI